MAVAVAVAGLTVTAAAYWVAAGTGTSLAGVSAFESPILKAVAGGETVQLEWSAVTPPGSGAVTYYVTGEGGTPGTGCPTAGAPSTVTSCTETGVSIGAHTYEVTAVWRSWTSASEKQSVTVTSGPATHLVLAASKTELVAGEAANLTVTAKDAANRTVTSYTGSHSLVFEGASAAPSGTKPSVSSETGTAVAFGEATAIKFTAGVATVEGANNGQLKLYRPEEAHLKVKAGALSNEGALVAIKVTVGRVQELPRGVGGRRTGSGGRIRSQTDGVGRMAQRAHHLRAHAQTEIRRCTQLAERQSAHLLRDDRTDLRGRRSDRDGLPLLRRGLQHAEGARRNDRSEKDPPPSPSKPAAAKRWAWSHPVVTAGNISSATCLFTCETTSIGNAQQFEAQASVTDE